MENINNLSCKNKKYRTDNNKQNFNINYNINDNKRDVDFGYKDIKNSYLSYEGCDCNLLNKDEKKFSKNKNHNIKPESIKCAEAKYKFRYLYNNKDTSKNLDVKKRQGYYKRILLNYCNTNPYSCSKTDRYNMPKKINELCGPKYLNVCDKGMKISEVPETALNYFSTVTKSLSDITDKNTIKNLFISKLNINSRIKSKKKTQISVEQKIIKIKNRLSNIKNSYISMTASKFDYYQLCNKYRDFDTALAFIKEYTFAKNINAEMNKIYSCIYNTDLLNKYIELELELFKLQDKIN